MAGGKPAATEPSRRPTVMKYRWNLPPPRPIEIRLLRERLGIGELAASCLVERGLSDPSVAAAHLDPKLRGLSDPWRLPAMRAAVDRLWTARANGEEIVLFGDYDVDGVTATAVLTEVLGSLGWKVAQFLPDRFAEGYGLTQTAATNCRAANPGATLWMAVDCGTTATGPIAWLREQGVDTLVLDHHQPGPELPVAVALVNPQLGTEEGRELCSAGLAFKLAHAVLKHGRDLGFAAFESFDLRPLLDLVALGTIADLVPLRGENRILARAGLERLATTRREGIVALKEVAGVDAPVRVEQVGYQLGPRLNAAGRLETARQALDLVLCRDAAKARLLAEGLDARNRERQAIEKTMSDDAIGAVRSRFDPARDYVVVEARLQWHIGVVGIVASRVLREFHRPTLIIGGEGGEWRGSGRSIAGFDLAAALRACDDLLVKHGGHAMAAGLTVLPERVDELRERLNRIARGCLSPGQLVPELRLDGSVGLDGLGAAVMAELARMEPFGQGNPAVQVLVPGLRHARPPQRLGREGRHWKFSVTDGRATMECVWWGAGDREVPVGDFDLAAVPETSEYGGRSQIRLKLLDWRPRAASV
ncbi:MAG: single-stranded-DNA-specific exonuclease RecJ [Verrucomicrobia bacterium]|nr:MAG: single-stranded-DNA-specific exonuclease RecJ [Verrucomicrobiota bacterium]